MYLTIEHVADRHYGNYSLRAGNMVGSAMTTVRLSRSVTDRSSSGDVRSRQQQRDAQAIAGDNTKHFRSQQPPSSGSRQS